ncbi:hypothetical protein F4677DRAFT_464166 [Hypoxylon crocopeplum]|nr:hypothetical protein F4677DRAFT_464166 [Hypoxylon crocopeplum]
MSQIQHIEKVALIGANGHVGKHFLEELLRTGVKSIIVNYDDENSLVSALKCQQFLIITLSVMTPPDTHGKIVKAAAKADVPYIMPNCHGLDFENEILHEENAVGTDPVRHVAQVKSHGISCIAIVCGFWYEWSLSLGEPFFGFDIKNKKVTFFDDGKTEVNISTWRQCGRALAALLSLPETGPSPALSDWKNNPVYIDSFRITQRDMLDSLNRVLGTTDASWEIKYEASSARYMDGIERMQKGDTVGFAKAMYSRNFYPNAASDFSAKGLANDILALPEDNLDEATKRAVEMVESGWNPFG